jgi:hypothetical protein
MAEDVAKAQVILFSGFWINILEPDVSLTALTVDLPLTVDRQNYVIRKLSTSSIWRTRQTKISLNETSCVQGQSKAIPAPSGSKEPETKTLQRTRRATWGALGPRAPLW